MVLKSLKASLGFLIVFVIALALITYLESLPIDQIKIILKETGPIEMFSVFFYIIAGLVALVLAIKNIWAQAAQATLIMFLMASRELDAHVKFTTMNFAKTRFFISHRVPLTEKVLVSIFLLAVLALVVYFIKSHWAGFVKAIKDGRAYAYTTGATVFFIPVSKILDSLPKILRDHFHLPVTDASRQFSTVFEEVFELIIPILFLLALLQYLQYKRTQDA